MELPPETWQQGGRFTYHQARAFGLNQRALARGVRDGFLEEVAHGVYAAVGITANAVEVHANLVRDAQLQQKLVRGPTQQCLVMGLPLIGRPPTVPQLVRDGDQHTAHGRDRHARISPLPVSDTWQYDGLDMCTSARTVVDIARAESFRNAVVTMDGALRRGTDPAEIEAVLTRMTRWPGVVGARRAFRFADGRAESAGESLVRVASLVEGLPIPEPQVEVYLWGEFIGRVDGLIREALLAVESDGAVKFTNAGVLPALIVRQEGLRYAGIDVFRTYWDETVKDTSQFGRRMRARLAERGVRPLPPGVELRRTVVRPQVPLLRLAA